MPTYLASFSSSSKIGFTNTPVEVVFNTTSCQTRLQTTQATRQHCWWIKSTHVQWWSMIDTTSVRWRFSAVSTLITIFATHQRRQPAEIDKHQKMTIWLDVDQTLLCTSAQPHLHHIQQRIHHSFMQRGGYYQRHFVRMWWVLRLIVYKLLQRCNQTNDAAFPRVGSCVVGVQEKEKVIAYRTE